MRPDRKTVESNNLNNSNNYNINNNNNFSTRVADLLGVEVVCADICSSGVDAPLVPRHVGRDKDK